MPRDRLFTTAWAIPVNVWLLYPYYHTPPQITLLDQLVRFHHVFEFEYVSDAMLQFAAA